MAISLLQQRCIPLLELTNWHPFGPFAYPPWEELVQNGTITEAQLMRSRSWPGFSPLWLSRHYEATDRNAHVTGPGLGGSTRQRGASPARTVYGAPGEGAGTGSTANTAPRRAAAGFSGAAKSQETGAGALSDRSEDARDLMQASCGLPSVGSAMTSDGDGCEAFVVPGLPKSGSFDSGFRQPSVWQPSVWQPSAHDGLTDHDELENSMRPQSPAEENAFHSLGCVSTQGFWGHQSPAEDSLTGTNSHHPCRVGTQGSGSHQPPAEDSLAWTASYIPGRVGTQGSWSHQIPTEDGLAYTASHHPGRVGTQGSWSHQFPTEDGLAYTASHHPGRVGIQGSWSHQTPVEDGLTWTASRGGPAPGTQRPSGSMMPQSPAEGFRMQGGLAPSAPLASHQGQYSEVHRGTPWRRPQATPGGAEQGRELAEGQHQPQGAAGAGITTLMVQNLPRNLTRKGFVSLIDACGFAGLYDCVHLPGTFATGKNSGYGFVNFVDEHAANAFAARFRPNPGAEVPMAVRLWRVAPAVVQGREAIEATASSRRMRRVRDTRFRPLLLDNTGNARATGRQQ